jgi:hypothetical protein
MIAHAGSSFEMTRVRVVDTAAAACADTTCPGASAGVGVGIYRGGHVTLRDFEIAQTALCGVQLASGGEADLEDGTIAESPIGINVQEADYDFDRLTRGVEHVGNGRNVDSAMLPIPEPLESTR